jgi:lactoylglutathione lyase
MYFCAVIDHINALVLPVRDVERCALFYRDKLGFNLDQIGDDEAYLTIGGKGGLVLAILSFEFVAKMISEERVRPREETIQRTYYVVFVNDVDKEYKELRRKGVHLVKPPTTQTGGSRTAHFEDPEGTFGKSLSAPKSRHLNWSYA